MVRFPPPWKAWRAAQTIGCAIEVKSMPGKDTTFTLSFA